jgi:hypothetical protein
MGMGSSEGVRVGCVDVVYAESCPMIGFGHHDRRNDRCQLAKRTRGMRHKVEIVDHGLAMRPNGRSRVRGPRRDRRAAPPALTGTATAANVWHAPAPAGGRDAEAHTLHIGGSA